MALDSSGYANRSNGITYFAEIMLDLFSTKYGRLDIRRILDIIQYSGFLYRTHDSGFLTDVEEGMRGFSVLYGGISKFNGK